MGLRGPGDDVMTDTADMGGDPACWVHLFEDHDEALTVEGGTAIVDLGALPAQRLDQNGETNDVDADELGR